MRHRLLTLLLALAATAAACDDPSGAKAGPPAKLDVVSGNAQEGTAGAELPAPLVVKVTDDRGRPVRGQLVNFRVTAGGGTVFASASITNADGIAQERWTVGTQAGSTQTVEARAIDSDTGEPLVFATFTATVKAAAPATITAAPAAGDTMRAGVAGAAANDSLRVLVKDQYGNPVPGAAVQWTVTTGGGTVAGTPTAQTGADGIARAVWALGTASGVTQNAQASVAGAGTVRYVANVATQLIKLAGDGQTAAVGTPVTVSVKLANSAGEGVGGIPVAWQVMSGGGSVAAGTPSGTQGVATVQWTLGTAAGVQVLSAMTGGLNVGFTATAQPSAARTLVAQVSGTVLDVDDTRVLWLDGTALKVRSRAGGGDVTVLADSAVHGKLFAGGVVGIRANALYEVKNGTSTRLGSISNGTAVPHDDWYAVKGSWLAWAASPMGPFLRRNLATGAVDTVQAAYSLSRRVTVDVGENGRVATDYSTGGNGGGAAIGTFWIAPGTSDVFYNAFTYGALHVKTDGNNVIFRAMESSGTLHLRLAQPGSSLALSSAPGGGFNIPVPDGRVAGNWVAYLYTEPGLQGQWYSEVRLRAPGFNGSPPAYSERVSQPSSRALLEALAPDGTVVYRQGALGASNTWTYPRRYISPRNAPTVDAGPATDNERVIHRDGDFYLLRPDGSVYALSW